MRSSSANSDKTQSNLIDCDQGRRSDDASISGKKISFKPYEDTPTSGSSVLRARHDDRRSCVDGSSSRKSSSTPPVAWLRPSPASKDSAFHSPGLTSVSQRVPSSPQPIYHQTSHSTNACTDLFCAHSSLSVGNRYSPISATSSVKPATLASPDVACHLSLASSAHHVKPFPCHWTVNGAYCGKSFSTCEQLLQHLKSHTLGSQLPYASLGTYYQHAMAGDRYHPYHKVSGIRHLALRGASTPAELPLLMPSPSPSLFSSSYHASLSSYYALLSSRVVGPGDLR